MKACELCGSKFEPDSYRRRQCEDCRDYGYRKGDPARDLRDLVGRRPKPVAA